MKCKDCIKGQKVLPSKPGQKREVDCAEYANPQLQNIERNCPFARSKD